MREQKRRVKIFLSWNLPNEKEYNSTVRYLHYFDKIVRIVYEIVKMEEGFFCWLKKSLSFLKLDIECSVY